MGVPIHLQMKILTLGLIANTLQVNVSRWCICINELLLTSEKGFWSYGK